MSEWQQIETAPKDCAFLGYMRITDDTWMITPMYWVGREFLCFEFYSDNTEHSVKPTHWQPIPPPPKGGI